MPLFFVRRKIACPLIVFVALVSIAHGGSGDSWADYTNNRTSYDDQMRDIRARRSSGSSSSEPYPGYARERAAELFRQNHQNNQSNQNSENYQNRLRGPVSSWPSDPAWEAKQRRINESAERARAEAAQAAAEAEARTRALLKLYDAANAGDADALMEVAEREADMWPAQAVRKYIVVQGTLRKKALWAAVRLIQLKDLDGAHSDLPTSRRHLLEELSLMGDVVATRERSLLSDLDKDVHMALKFATKAALAGDLESQRRVVLIMATGKIDGVVAPPEQVYAWCREAGEAGNVAGQVLYARALFWGSGIEQNLPEAFVWFQKAIAADPKTLTREEDALRVQAINLAGTMLLMGNGVAEDKPAGFALIEQAARLGNAAAELNAANCYLLGDGVQKNPQEAVRWFEIAAEAGNAEAARTVASIYFSPEEPVYDEAAGLRWTQRFSKRDPQAMISYAEFIHDGRYGLRADPAKAKELFGMALQKYPDEPYVLNAIGVMTLKGLNEFAPDPAHGIDLLKQAYERGSSISARSLQRVYANGVGVTANAAEAGHWKELADAAGAPEISID